MTKDVHANLPLIHTPIAIVGLACRLPGADGLAAYWDLLSSGRNMAADMPPERLNRELYFDPVKGKRGRTYSARGAFLNARPLDLARVPLSSDDLQNSDPCHQILCEVAAEAVWHAGWNPFQFSPGRCGVFVGHSGGSELGGELAFATLAEEVVAALRRVEKFNLLSPEQQTRLIRHLVDTLRARRPERNERGGPETGSHNAAGLIAKALKLSGPQVSVDAACASSLVALALGSVALQQNEVDVALVGGASFNKCDSMILFSHAQSCTARDSRPFDNDADGLLSSEGYVVLALKTLDRALADGDRVRAVVRGLGVSTDGRGKSLWAPRKEGQVAAMRRAYSSEITPASVGYVEAHATSTQVGDATEVDALREFFQASGTTAKIPIGSVKSNLGHTLETAGLAGLVKTVLALQHGVIPPSINVHELNREIPWHDLPFYVAREKTHWPRSQGAPPRRAAVNAFGIGGLNVHVVLDEFDPAYAPTSNQRTTSTDEIEPIAIVGRGVILPGAMNVGQLAQLLASGRSEISPPERLVAGMSSLVPHLRGGYVRNYEYDWRKYKIPPKQVAQANPLQFMLLDAARQALEEAGQATLEGSLAQRTAVVVGSAFGGVFGNQLQVGLRLPELCRDVRHALRDQGLSVAEIDAIAQQLEQVVLDDNPALLDETGSFTASTLASRITKTLDLMGGALAIDANNCSSLAALHAACGLLRTGSVAQVLCAGASRSMDLVGFDILHRRGCLAGTSRPTNAYVAPYYPAEGVAVVLLKRLSDAQRSGDKILGVIGRVNASSLAQGNTSSTTSLHAFPDPLVSQIGHAQSAQGIVSLVSATLRPPESRTIIRDVHSEGLEYRAEFAISPQLLSHQPRLEESPRVTNPSAPTTAVPLISVPTSNSPPRIYRWSGPQVAELIEQISTALGQADCSSAAVGHFHPDHVARLAIVASDAASLQAKLELARKRLRGDATSDACEEQGVYLATSRRPARVAWLFPGQGSQYADMLRPLFAQSAAARDKCEEANTHLRALTGDDFAALAWDHAPRLGHDIWTTQAAMLVADYMLLAALRERGVACHVVTGHSYGEFAALLAAGVWTLPQALAVTQVRSQAIRASRCVAGGLLSLDATAERVAALVEQHGNRVYLSHYNAPRQTVVGGEESCLTSFAALAATEGLNARPLAVPSAFHTPLLADTQAPLAASLEQQSLLPPRIPVLSSVTNRYVAEPADIRANLVQQMVAPVRFLPLVQRLANEGVNIFIEVGPQQVLTRLTRQSLAGRDVLLLPTDHPKRSPEEMLLRVQAACECWDALEAPVASSVSRSTAARELPATEHFDATARRRERKREHAPPIKSVVPPSSPPEHFDATEQRREMRRQRTNIVVEQPFKTSAPESIVAATTPPVAVTPIAATTTTSDHDGKKLERFLVDFVVEQTGYPADMIDLDWDMEADLGIDSIKRAQLFGELREFFDLETAAKGGLSLDRFRSLRQVLDFLRDKPGKTAWLNDIESTPVASPPVPLAPAPVVVANAVAPLVASPAQASRGNEELETFLVKFVVEQTGYPAEIVELDADLEADLGIDSIKKAQLFGELREHFELPLEKMGRLKLADYRTLRQVMEVLIAHLPQASVQASVSTTPLVTTPPPTTFVSEPVAVAPSTAFLEGERWGVEHRTAAHTWLRERADAAFDTSGGLATNVSLLDDSNSSSADQERLQGMAVGTGLHFANVLAFERFGANSPTPAKSNGNGHDHEQAVSVNKLGEEPTIASRYVLSMKPAPVTVSPPYQPTWHGGAVILGNNPLARALQQRLASEGCRAHLLSATEDVFSAAEELERLWAQGPLPHLFIVSPRDAAAQTTLDAVAWQQNRRHGLLTPFWLCQRWFKLMNEAGLMDQASVVATLSLGGDFGLSGNIAAAEGGAIGGMLKAMFIESWVNGHRTTPYKIIDAAANVTEQEILDCVWRELAVPSLDVEIGLLHGQRHTVAAERLPLPERLPNNIRRGAVWVCTGGARGITAFVATELARRFGIKLQLIGASPDPQIPAHWRDLDDAGLKSLKLQVMQQARAEGKNAIKAWQDTEKLLEIDATLRSLHAEGIDARYYSCDVSNRVALARVLQDIRTQVGPIEGVLHGAGVGKDSRFERKEIEKVEQCFAAKVDGALALMDLTRRDPLKHFIAFGSISGRFGANGHTDYSAANDMLCKLVNWYRRQQPRVHAVAFHWHAWGDIGMATKPEVKLALEMVDMQFMPAREGLQHLLNELAAGTPVGEALITDDRYYRMFYPAETLSATTTGGGSLACPLLDAGEQQPSARGTRYDVALDPLKEPFLLEHRLDDRPLLPVVVGLQLLAEGAVKLLKSRSHIAFHDVSAVNGLRFFTDQPLTAQVIASSSGPSRCHVELLSDFHARDGRLVEPRRSYLTGDVELTNAPAVTSRSYAQPEPGSWEIVEYAPRGGKFYVGPPLRALREIRTTQRLLWGRIYPPMLQELAGKRRSVEGWVVPSAALDACLYAVGLHAWKEVRPGPSLPFRFGRIALGRLPQPGEACLLLGEFLKQEDRYADFAFTLFGQNGELILDVRDYRIVYLA